MSEKLLQEILKELKSLNEWQAQHYVHLSKMDHKLELLIDATESKHEFMRKRMDVSTGDILSELTDLKEKWYTKYPI